MLAELFPNNKLYFSVQIASPPFCDFFNEPNENHTGTNRDSKVDAVRLSNVYDQADLEHRIQKNDTIFELADTFILVVDR